MVISCSAYGCTNRRQKGSSVHFHRFPLNRPNILKKRIHAMKRKNFTPNQYTYLCSEHFGPEDYQIRPGSDIKLLLEYAVPSIFKGFPQHLQRKEKIVRRQLFKNDQLINNDHEKHMSNEECSGNILVPSNLDLKCDDDPSSSISSLVTCGICKIQMTFEDYDSKHRSSHYNLCWLDGIENEIDFMDTPNIIKLLRKTSNNKCRSGRHFKCERCDEVKRTMAGFAKHLRIFSVIVF